ncbi:glycan metabolism protein RagB [Adhaeribacter aerolatus]|uniref:Glycan metabolism protein RagB n=1 Tax=Adhaeribacter aerolatus TaxID=670289 RepID=A0A512AYG9_9BACT|nr:RagB/SusD family nutrient uptake outer membrane protein [Adhaeribacter aerolatus]GEO04772.1 glycan metabolism protein RagB [Adhaeribacter aerolatus]
MKTKLLTLLIGILLSGCIEDVLDRKPLNLISDKDVWQSEQLIDIYLVSLYDAIPMGFTSRLSQSALTDEATYPDGAVVKDFGNVSHTLNTGMYAFIRNANYFLEQVKTSPLPPEKIAVLTAECRFIRAFYYLDLVKKYGGMPIIQEVQTFNNNLPELQVKRNTEAEVYDFILQELDEAAKDLPETQATANSNRATKYTALALKSRAMLYAGSVAKYGNVQLNGLAGIPADKATKYFTESLNAAKAVIQGNKFALYDKLYNPETKAGDPAANYQNIFRDEGNKEVIFQKAYRTPDKAHSYDNWFIPEGYTTNNGSGIAPTLEMVESYEYIDGRPGKLEISNKVYNSADAIFKDKDPRFDGSILRSGSPFAGRPVQIYRGIYGSNGTLYESLAPFPEDPAMRQVGRDGPFPEGNFSKTGFYIKKYMNTANAVVEPNFSDQNYIEIRYAEVLLNYAEAAFELGDVPLALDAINQVRKRAGIKTLTAGELTMERLRNERKVELAFEDKRLWDIRRWRIGTDLFRNTYLHGLWPYLKYENGQYKYMHKAVSGYPIDDGLPRVFNERDYYSTLSGYIATNEQIVNNPGW